MCGISGIISGESDIMILDKLKKSTGSLIHRGPEKNSVWTNIHFTVGLGHNRLSIIDLSIHAAQPMHYQERYTIIYNGELYNYLELKKELQSKGYIFNTESDTEVILASFACYGKDCLKNFDGMFALAIWDNLEEKLFLARDRFGEKPLFFYFDGQNLFFASEMKALWAMGADRLVNRSMLYNYLTIGYTSNPTDPEETFFQGIHKLPAGNFMIYDKTQKELVMETYWQLRPEVNTFISENQAIEQFEELFCRSIKRMLRSDVPIGTSLSGGLDSTAVVSYCDSMATLNYSHKCFTASFPGFEKDELALAKRLAGIYHLQQFSSTVDENDLAGLMTRVMEYQEEPISSASALAQFKVYELAKNNGIKVLLDGQGADEILGGYHKYFKWYWQELYRKGRLNKSMERTEAALKGIKEPFGIRNKVAALLPHWSASLLEASKSKRAFRQKDLNADFAFENKRNLYYALPSEFSLNGALFFNTTVIGLEELLRIADRNSMAHGMEVRLPFLSHQLVEFLFTLPPELKIHKGWTKWILRKSLEKRLDPEFAWKNTKIGFEPPQERWMKHKKVDEAIKESKLKLIKMGILNKHIDMKIKPHSAYAAYNLDWKYWSSSYLF